MRDIGMQKWNGMGLKTMVLQVAELNNKGMCAVAIQVEADT